MMIFKASDNFYREIRINSNVCIDLASAGKSWVRKWIQWIEKRPTLFIFGKTVNRWDFYGIWNVETSV